jgi:hypothetical protein
MLDSETARLVAHLRSYSPFIGWDQRKKRGPTQHDHALPKFGRQRVTQMMTLANWEILQTAFSLVCLTDITEPCRGIYGIYHGTLHFG